MLQYTGDRKKYESVLKCFIEGAQLLLLNHVTIEFDNLCVDMHHTIYEVIFVTISPTKQLAQLANSSIDISELPKYSFWHKTEAYHVF